MFTTGRLLFTLFFVVCFILGLVWSYRKEKNINKIHFNKTYRILFAIILFFTVLFLIVKLRKFI
jgi:uncharacterized membrane protein